MPTFKTSDGRTITLPDKPDVLDTTQAPVLPQPTAPAVEEEEEISTLSQLGDIGRGVGSGIIGIPEGIASLPTIAVDLAFDTDYTSSVEELADKLRDASGLQPQTSAGEVAETLSTFAIAALPVVGWMGTAGKAAQAARVGATVPEAATSLFRGAQTFGRTTAGQALLAPKYAQGGGRLAQTGARFQAGVATSLAAGASDAIVAPDGTSTLSDHFDALPEFLQTNDDGTLTGREDALRRVGNKFRIFTESSALGVLLGDVALPAAGLAVGQAGRIAGFGVQKVADLPVGAGGLRFGNTVNAGFEVLSNTLRAATPESLSELGRGGKEALSKYFTSARGLTSDTAGLIDDTVNNIGAYEKFTLKLLSGYHNEAVKMFGRLSPYFGKGKEAYTQSYNDLVRYLEGDLEAMANYPKPLRQTAERMAEERNKFSQAIYERMEEMFRNGEFGEGTAAREQYIQLRKAFKENEGKYLRRVFQRNIGSNELDIEQTIKEFDQLDKKGALPKKFKLAVREVDEVMKGIGGEFGAMSDRQRQEAAIRFVYDNVRRRVADVPEETADDALMPFATTNASKLRASVGELLNPFADPTPRVKINEGALKGRSQVIDQSPLLRELMGETKGTKLGAEARYLDTMMNLVKINEASKLYQNLLNTPGLTATADEIIGQTAVRPMIVRAEEAASLLGQTNPQSYNEFMKDYVLVSGRSDTVFGGDFGALGGQYVRKELFDALTTLPFNRGPLGLLASAGVRTKSYLQQAVVTLNPVALARNTFGGVYFMTANGHIPRGGDLFDSLALTLTKVGNAPLGEGAEYMQKAQRLGVIDQSVRANEIAETARGTLIEARQKPTSSPLQIFNRKITEKLGQGGVIAGQKLKGVAKLPYTVPQGIQQFGDSFYKLAGWNAERARLDSAMRAAMLDSIPDQTGRSIGPGNAVTAELWDDLADDFMAQGLAKRTRSADGDNFFDTWTADTVTDMYPTYFKIPTAGRAVIRTPVVGTFAGFMSEVIRNSGNILNRAGREINFRSTPEIAEKLGRRIVASKGLDESAVMEVGTKAANELARQINAIGAKRATGFYTTTFMSSAMIAAGAASLLGLTDEEMEAIQQSKPAFYEGQKVVPLTKPKDGVFEIMPVSYYNPQDSIGSAVGAAMEAYAKGEELNEDWFTNIVSSGATGVSKFLTPFTDESLLQERLADVTFRRGRTKTGAYIYRELPSLDGRFDADDTGEKIEKSITHLLGALTPAATDMFYEFDPSDPDRFKKGRLLKAFEGEPTAQREILDPAAEVFALSSGARSIRVNNPRSLMFDALAFSRARTAGPLGEFNAEKRKADTTVPKLRAQWYDSQFEQHRNAQELFLTMERNRKTGVSEDKIEDMLRENNIPQRTVNALLENRYDFSRISDRFVEDIRERIEEKPELAEYYNNLASDPNRTLLTPDDMELLIEDLNERGEIGSEEVPLDQPFPPYEFFFPDEAPAVAPQSSIAPQVTEEPVNIAAVELPSAPIPSTVAPVAATQQPVDPGLLGDNPIEVARNLELANRLRGQS